MGRWMTRIVRKLKVKYETLVQFCLGNEDRHCMLVLDQEHLEHPAKWEK